jgi:hypothetical protein
MLIREIRVEPQPRIEQEQAEETDAFNRTPPFSLFPPVPNGPFLSRDRLAKISEDQRSKVPSISIQQENFFSTTKHTNHTKGSTEKSWI